MKVCSIEGCNNPMRARGWCSTHWGRWYQYGDPLATVRAYYAGVPVEGDGDPRHGKISTYNNHGCRCALCRAGWAKYKNEWNNATPERRLKRNEYERNRSKRAKATQ